MEPATVQTVAMRAVELLVQGRSDPRLLVASCPELRGPKKTARLLAGLTNAAGGRTPLLLAGVDGTHVVGVSDVPDEGYWARVRRGFAGHVPSFEVAAVAVDDATVVAVRVEPGDVLVPARRGDGVEVPFYRDGELHQTPGRLERVPEPPPLAVRLRVGPCWMERIPVATSPGVVAYRGQIDVALPPRSGIVADGDCAAAFVEPDSWTPVTLSAQIHPLQPRTAVRRLDGGVSVDATLAARIHLATAVRVGPVRPASGVAQLVLEVRVPGLTEPELRTVMMLPDPTISDRWVAGTSLESR